LPALLHPNSCVIGNGGHAQQDQGIYRLSLQIEQIAYHKQEKVSRLAVFCRNGIIQQENKREEYYEVKRIEYHSLHLSSDDTLSQDLFLFCFY
jgi:hypothetical protein